METGKRPQTIEQRQKQTISRLTNENAKLRKEMKEGFAQRDQEIFFLKESLEKALLHIEELQKYVFRGKKNDDDDDDKDKKDNDKNNSKSGHSNRDKSSYRRELPEEKDITNEEIFHLDNCPDCHSKLTRLKILEFFTSDIIPIIEWFKALKKVTRKKITSGYCPQCKKRVSAAPIPKQKVCLGENIRQLTVYLYTVQQLSYTQIIDFAQSCLHFKLSKGEIVNILEDTANKLRSAFEDLKKSIRKQSGVHLDETSWKVAFENEFSGNYAWVMVGVEKNDVVYSFGQNRGQGIAKKLIGENYEGIGITDNYGSYDNLFKTGKHALCWAHPQRKIKDLKNSNSLDSIKKKRCKITYKKFSKLYDEIRKINQCLFVKEERLKTKKTLMKKFEKITKLNKNDPKKLQTIKNSLIKFKDCYFVCITEPNISPDNNKAERALRHLVIKRKKSFGSKTPKGADILSVIYSVVMSLWYRDKENFFNAYNEILAS